MRILNLIEAFELYDEIKHCLPDKTTGETTDSYLVEFAGLLSKKDPGLMIQLASVFGEVSVEDIKTVIRSDDTAKLFSTGCVANNLALLQLVRERVIR